MGHVFPWDSQQPRCCPTCTHLGLSVQDAGAWRSGTRSHVSLDSPSWWYRLGPRRSLCVRLPQKAGREPVLRRDLGESLLAKNAPFITSTPREISFHGSEQAPDVFVGEVCGLGRPSPPEARPHLSSLDQAGVSGEHRGLPKKTRAKPVLRSPNPTVHRRHSAFPSQPRPPQPKTTVRVASTTEIHLSQL